MEARARMARPEDAPALGGILSDWIDATDWMPRLHTREEDAAFVASLIARTTVLTLELADRPSGFLALDGESIPAFYLAPEARGNGNGTLMLSQAKTRRKVLSLWAFRANEHAIRFYRRLGFVETNQTDGDNDAGLPDVQMTWRAA